MENKKQNWQEKIYAYALKNALSHDGKAQEGAIISSLFHEGLQKEEVKDIIKDVKDIVRKVNSFSLEEQEKENSKFSKLTDKREQEKDLPELPGVKGKVVLRLAPYPSGALHIGNARTYLLNAFYAEKYKGKLLFIMDDTIGSEEKQIVKEAYKLIPDSFKWLKVNYKKPIIYKSDRLKIYYKYAEKLIELGKAYVCSCSQEDLRKNRVEMQECACRQFPPEEQMKRWKKMFKAKEGAFTLRIKTSLQHPNPAFRDRVLFRISDRAHPRVGKKYKVWPLLDFSWAIDDYLLHVTHIIRGKDLMMESEMEKYIWKIFNWPDKVIIHSGLIRIEGIEGAKISKSKAQKEVKSGKFIGWDDPRTWSIQSLKRRGILPESIREFVKELGLTENDVAVPIDSLYSINRKIIDKIADRYSFVREPVKLEIKNMPEIKSVKVKIHPDKKQTREISIKDIFISQQDLNKFKGKEVRLMHLFNVKLDEKVKFTSLENKDIQKIHWVSEYVPAKILMPEGIWIKGFAEKEISKLKIGDIIQFERFGFVRFDKKPDKDKEYEFWFTHK